MVKLYDCNELSKVLGLSPNYILNCSTKYPDRLPKSFKINGVRRWRETDVERWLDKKYKESVSYR